MLNKPLSAALALACVTTTLASDTPTPRELDEAIQLATAGGYWGAALVVHEGETLLRRGYGDADYAGTPNTPETLFEIASVSKQFTAATVLTVVEDGALSLDATFEDLFPARAGDNGPITVRHLLTHTSGVSANGTQPYASTIDREGFLDAVFIHPPDFEPGTGTAYSNVGYALLAAIVEEVTGEPFESVMRERVFTPAGLRDTGFVNDPRLDRTRAATRLSDRTPGTTAADWFYGWGYRGMGGVVTTVDDLLLWHRALNTDRVLSAPMRNALFAPDDAGNAFGWNIAIDPLGNPVARHGGAVEGFRSVVRRHLETDSLIVLLSNSNNELFGLIDALDDELHPVPSASLRIDVGDRAMGEFGQIELDAGASLRARPADAGALIELVDTNGEIAATLRTPIEVVGPFARRLDAILRERGDDNQPEPQTEAGIYLYAYNKARQVNIDNLVLDAQPRYRGRGENGEIITDERVLVTFIDESRSFWPVMVKMNTKAARTFLEAINDALATD